MTNAKFKFENRDVVIVTGAENAESAASAAEALLAEVSENDATTDYGIDNRNIQYMEANENGEYEFRVVIANK